MNLSYVRSILTRLRSTAAETLAEVIIAMVVLSVGGTGAATLVQMAINANADAEERIVAYNFAREGVEAVRNLRDTNWLRFPGNKAECWDTLNATSALDCGLSTKLASDDYLVSLEISDTDSLFEWQFSADDGGSTTDDLLYANTVDGATIHNHDTAGTPTKFHRIVTIDKESPTCANICVKSVVTWEFKGQPRSVTFYDELSNY